MIRAGAKLSSAPPSSSSAAPRLSLSRHVARNLATYPARGHNCFCLVLTFSSGSLLTRPPPVSPCSFEHPGGPGGGAHRPAAHAPGQHAAGGGRGGPREGRRLCGRGGCGGGLRRGRVRQLGGALGLPGQAVPDPADLPHGAGEVRAGNACRRGRGPGAGGWRAPGRGLASAATPVRSPLGDASSSSGLWDPVGRDAGTDWASTPWPHPDSAAEGGARPRASCAGGGMARTSLCKSRGPQGTPGVRPSWAPALTPYGRPVGPGAPHALPQKLPVYGKSATWRRGHPGLQGPWRSCGRLRVTERGEREASGLCGRAAPGGARTPPAAPRGFSSKRHGEGGAARRGGPRAHLPRSREKPVPTQWEI